MEQSVTVGPLLANSDNTNPVELAVTKENTENHHNLNNEIIKINDKEEEEKVEEEEEKFEEEKEKVVTDEVEKVEEEEEKVETEGVEKVKEEEAKVEEEEEKVEEEEEEEEQRVEKEEEEKIEENEPNCEECNDEQTDASVNTNSQFYESSDSKLDYAVKIDDNDTLSDIDDIKTDTTSADSEDSALGSLPPDATLNDREEEGQDRSDGSDSGLGSDVIDDVKIPNFNIALPCSSGLDKEEFELSVESCKCNKISEQVGKDDFNIQKPLRTSLKRKLEDTPEGPRTKIKKTIRFDDVTVFYFPRTQGFSCVPSQGGATLGMEWEHTYSQNFSLGEHAMEQRRLHRQLLQQLKNERHTLQGASMSSSDDSDTEEEASDISESELDLDSYYFLQPVPTRQRRALLRAAGIRKIESYEKDECRDIRTSREFCGCACKGVCNPDTCSCNLAGIKCQVDRLNFPCGCTRDGCKNTTGRIEFNPVRVRTHFIHTLMRVGLEKKNEENQEAAKRLWSETHTLNKSVCMSSYENERCHGHEDGLLRDVSLSPRVEVESCVSSANFNNFHCDVTNSTSQSNMHSDLGYGYRAEQNHRNTSPNSPLHLGNPRNINIHIHPYTPNMIPGKDPPYISTSNTDSYNVSSSNVQRYPCDLNYSYTHHETHFKGLHSFPASNFEEFAHSSQASMFTHYGHMYGNDYLSKPNTSMHDPNMLHYQAISSSPYDMNPYKNVAEIDSDNKETESHYTTLMSLPYHSNKLEAINNDENLYNHNTLLDQSTQDATELETQETAQPTESTMADSTDNFGELIKKTMVESVNV